MGNFKLTSYRFIKKAIEIGEICETNKSIEKFHIRSFFNFKNKIDSLKKLNNYAYFLVKILIKYNKQRVNQIIANKIKYTIEEERFFIRDIDLKPF